MHRFTDQGRRLAAQTCPLTGSRHEPEPAAAAVDTFQCKRCGAVPKDSIWYDMDERYVYDRQRDDKREDHG